jgi:hypothetical protein
MQGYSFMTNIWKYYQESIQQIIYKKQLYYVHHT